MSTTAPQRPAADLAHVWALSPRPAGRADPGAAHGTGGRRDARWHPDDPRATTPLGTPAWLPSVLAAVCLLGACRSLSPVLIGDGWWWAAVGVVGVIVGVGIAARALDGPRWLAPVAQLLVWLVVPAALFDALTPGSAFDRVGAAIDYVRHTVAPAATTGDLMFVLVSAFALTAVAVDLLAVRAPALVALPVLGVLLVGMTFALGGLPLSALLAPAVSYVLLLLVAGQGSRGIDVAAVPRVAAATTGITVAALGGALLVAPIGGVGTAGHLTLDGGASGPALSADLVGDLLRADPVPLLEVTGQPFPGYLRTAALESWSVQDGWQLGPVDDGVVPQRPTGTEVVVESVQYSGQFLPLPDGTTGVAGDDVEAWSWDPSLLTLSAPEPVNPGTYLAYVDRERPSDADLRADHVTTGGPLTEVGDLPEEVRALAVEVTDGRPTVFDKAQALQQWFTDPANGFVYSLELADPVTGDPLVDFLRNRQGYCEQYASAMAVMMRSLDIPARVVVGFGQGTLSERGMSTYTTHDAHAWVEVRFDDAGWVRFDPTPSDGTRGRQQGYDIAATVDPQQDATTSSGQQVQPGTADVPLDLPTDPGDLANLADEPTDAVGAVVTEQSGPRWWWWWIVLASLVVTARVVPGTERRRRRSVRLRRVSSGAPDAASAAWAEIEDLALDHGVPVPPTQSLRGTARRLAPRARLDPEARGRLGVVVGIVEREWYADRPAEPAERAALAAAVAEIRAGFARVGLTASERWLPRSLLRRRRRQSD